MTVVAGLDAPGCGCDAAQGLASIDQALRGTVDATPARAATTGCAGSTARDKHVRTSTSVSGASSD